MKSYRLQECGSTKHVQATGRLCRVKLLPVAHMKDVVTFARDRDSDTEDCYVLVVLFFKSFFPFTDFSTSWADFRETLPHDAVCPEIFSVFHQATQANSAFYPQWDGNKFQPKCGDALRLGSKGRYGSFHLWINVWVTGKAA